MVLAAHVQQLLPNIAGPSWLAKVRPFAASATGPQLSMLKATKVVGSRAAAVNLLPAPVAGKLAGQYGARHIKDQLLGLEHCQPGWSSHLHR